MFTIRLAVHPLPLPHDSLSSSLSPQGPFTLSSCITTGQTTTWRTRSHFHTVISRRVGELAFFSLFRGSAWVRFPFFVWIFFFPPPSRGFMCNEFRIQLWSLWKLRLIFMTDILFICNAHVSETCLWGRLCCSNVFRPMSWNIGAASASRSDMQLKSKPRLGPSSPHAGDVLALYLSAISFPFTASLKHKPDGCSEETINVAAKRSQVEDVTVNICSNTLRRHNAVQKNTDPIHTIPRKGFF